MLCTSPISLKIGLVGCGQCLPCRINRRRVWVHRLMLESSLYKDNAFVTLSYSPENLPRLSAPLASPMQGPDGRGNLVPAHLRNFLKRFRKVYEPNRIRFYGVGEYGDDSELPHFHLAVFNYPQCQYIQTRIPRRFNHAEFLASGKQYCCPVCDAVYRSWGMGLVYLGTLDPASCNYIAGYVLKKMTTKDDIRLLGRHPEFSRQSNRPGIAADAMHDVASVLLDFNLAEREGDVPSALRHGKRLLPLGRYLRRKLRLYVTGSEDAPAITVARYLEENDHLRNLQMDQKGSHSLKETYLAQNQQRLWNTDRRYQIFKKGKRL